MSTSSVLWPSLARQAARLMLAMVRIANLPWSPDVGPGPGSGRSVGPSRPAPTVLIRPDVKTHRRGGDKNFSVMGQMEGLGRGEGETRGQGDGGPGGHEVGHPQLRSGRGA